MQAGRWRTPPDLHQNAGASRRRWSSFYPRLSGQPVEPIPASGQEKLNAADHRRRASVRPGIRQKVSEPLYLTRQSVDITRSCGLLHGHVTTLACSLAT